MKATIVRNVPLVRTPRVMQVESMFDVPAEEKSNIRLAVDIPLGDRDWNVGLIVGPSGSGKTTVARELFGDYLVCGHEWSPDAAVVDGFPAEMGIKDVVGLLTDVGFSSPPHWLRPFRVLSNGEQFRVTVARALAESSGLVVIDEFTSVVDRQVAQVASHTVQKSVRRSGRKIIAVSCHYDIIDWLRPDWVYQPHGGAFEWRCLQRGRPSITAEIRSVSRKRWLSFGKYHYMSDNLVNSSSCFGMFVGGVCVAFAAIYKFPHPKVADIQVGHRLVVLPDYQGVGLGGAFDDWLGEYLWCRGWRYRNTVAHSSMVAHYSRSPRWRLVGVGPKPTGKKSDVPTLRTLRSRQVQELRRATVTFEYAPLTRKSVFRPLPVIEAQADGGD